MEAVVLNVAAKAVIVNSKNEILVVRESISHDTNTQVERWGIPGGRLEAGESFFDALNREVMEEVGLEVTTLEPLYVGEWSPNIRGVTHQIVAIFYLCKLENESHVRLSSEHDDYRWVSQKDYSTLNYMQPDEVVLNTAFSKIDDR